MQKFIHTNNSLKNLIFENEKYNLSNYKKFLINENNHYIDALTTFLTHVNNQNFKHFVTKCYEDDETTDVFFVLNMLIAGFLSFNNHSKEFDIYQQFLQKNDNKIILFSYIMYDYFICRRHIIEIDSKNIKINKDQFNAAAFEKQVNCEYLGSSQYTDKHGIKKAKLSDDYEVTQEDVNELNEYLEKQQEYNDVISYIQSCIDEAQKEQGGGAQGGGAQGGGAQGGGEQDGSGAQGGGEQDGGEQDGSGTKGGGDEGGGAQGGGAQGGGAQGGGAQGDGTEDDETEGGGGEVSDKIKDILSDKIEDNISLFNNSILGRFSKKEKINNKEIIDLISKYIKNESYNYLKHKNILFEKNETRIKKINIHDLFNDLTKEVINQQQEQILGINRLIKRKLNEKYEQIKERKGFLRGEKTITNDQFKKLLFDSISSVTNLNENQIVYLFDNINELNENKITYNNLLNENKQKYSFNNIGKLIALAKLTFPDEENIVIDLVGFKKLKKNEDKFDFLFDKILFRWDLFYRVAYAEVVCKSILENKDELLKASLKIVGQLPDPGVQSKNASVVSSVLSSKIKTKLGKDKRDITDQDIQRELEESVADICLGILRMYDGETYNKYQKSIDDDIVAQYNQGDGWYKRGFEKLFNVGDVTKRVRHETTHKTSEQVKTRLLQQEVKKIIEAFIALTKTVKPDLQQDHKLFTGNIINENNLIYKQFKLLIEQEKDESQEDTEEKETEAEEKETDESTEQETDESTEQETDDTKSDYKISVAKLKQVLQANGVLIYGKSAQNIDAKTRKESEHYMLEMFSSFLSINFDIEVTGVKKYKYDDLIRDQIIAAGNINTQPKEGQVSSERIEKLTQGSGLPTKIGDITLEQLVSLLNAAGKSDQLVKVLTTSEQNRQEIIKEIIEQPATQQQFSRARKSLPNLSKKITHILFKKENVQKIKDKLNAKYTFKDDHFKIEELQKFFNIIEEGSIKFDDNLKDKFIEFTKEFLDFKGNSYERYDEFVRDEICCNILNKVFNKADINKKISTGFIDKLQNCRNGKGLKNLVGDTVYNAEIGKKPDDKVDIEQIKTAIQTQFEKDTKLDDLTLEASKKMSSGLILREGVRVSSVDEVMREFGELKREFRNIYRY